MWSARRRRRSGFLAELNLPAVVSIRDLCDEVARRVGRAVVLKPSERTSSVCGASAVTKDAVYVFYNPRTSRVHQDHIIAHELSHLLLGHHESPRASVLDPSLFPSLDPAAVKFMLGRTTYEEAEERDTELLASLLQRQIIDRQRYSDEPSGDEVQDRVTHTLLRRRETR